MNEQERVGLYIEQAHRADRSSNEKKWIECLWSSKIVGKYSSRTKDLADRLGVEVDTVEDAAHVYWIFEELVSANDNLYRTVVFAARRSPFIHVSHFRVLYDAKIKYNLTIEQIFMYLLDCIQQEGGMSARALERNLKQKHDKELDWTWYAQGTLKSISITLGQPDLPDEIRKVLQPAYDKLEKW